MAREADDLYAELHHTLWVIQRATLYLASFAVAEYRGTAKRPRHKAEMAIATYFAPRGQSYANYTRMLIQCVRSLDRSVLHPLLEAIFVSALELASLNGVLTPADPADRAAYRMIGPQIENEKRRIDAERRRKPVGSSFRFEELLEQIGKFRNGYAHTEVHGIDAAEDFVGHATPILSSVAGELLAHEAVTGLWERLEPARLLSVDAKGPQFNYRLASFQGPNVRVTLPTDLTRTFCEGRVPWKCKPRGVLLVEHTNGEVRIVGPYNDLTPDDDPISPEIEASTRAVLQYDGLTSALDVIEQFRRAAKGKVDGHLPPELVDEVVVAALQEFKLTTHYYDEDIPGRVVNLLDYASPNLPTRIKRDAERFAAVTVRPPRASPRAEEGDPMDRAIGGSAKRRCEAVIELGELSDPDSLALLEALALTADRRKVRKHALLALGLRGNATSLPLLQDVAQGHRSDPELASCALIGIAGIKDVGSVAFLCEYVLSDDAPYRCTDAAAWALVLIAQGHPESVLPWRERLIGLTQNRDADHYTRGTIVCCLGKLGDKVTGAAIAGLINEDEDPFVIEDACAALGEIADADRVDALVKVLETGHGVLSDMAVQGAARIALGKIGCERSRSALAEHDGRDGAAR